MKLSVALCTYNGERFLQAQIQSILEQTHPVDEIVICDDHSTDATIDIIKAFLPANESRIRLHINPTSLGTIKNFEKAISLTTGEYIFLCDQDDVWEPNKVAATLSFFQNTPGCVLYFTNGKLIGEDGQPLGSTLYDKWNFTPVLQQQWRNNKMALQYLVNNDNKVTGATACFLSLLKPDVLPIKVPYGIWHDTWLAMHAAKMNGLYFTDDCLIRYRIHSSQQVGITAGGNSAQKPLRKEIISQEEYSRYLKAKFRPFYKFYAHKKVNFLERVLRAIKRRGRQLH